MSILGIDHVALAVHSIEEAVEQFEPLLETSPDRETVEKQGVKLAAFEIGESRLEIIEPLDDGNTIDHFLDEHGEGIHHLAFRTDTIDEELSRMQELDITCIDETPREGADGYQIGFLHPRDTHGALIELAQPLIRSNEDI